jgi:hypothetical protein
MPQDRGGNKTSLKLAKRLLGAKGKFEWAPFFT